MTTSVSEKKLQHLIKESVRKALEIELMKLRVFAVPEISEKEQKDIEKRYGRPSQRRTKASMMRI